MADILHSLSADGGASSDVRLSPDMELARSMLRRSYIEIQKLQALLESQGQRLKEAEARKVKQDDCRVMEMEKALESEKAHSRSAEDRCREAEERLRETKSVLASREAGYGGMLDDRKRVRADMENLRRRIHELERSERLSAEEKTSVVSRYVAYVHTYECVHRFTHAYIQNSTLHTYLSTNIHAQKEGLRSRKQSL
jgi:chromosome segregation ATPase